MPDLPTVLCYGDSNTHGADPASSGRHPRDVRWPGVAARELAGRADVIEEGLNGRTTIWDDPFSSGRNGRDYLLPCLTSHAAGRRARDHARARTTSRRSIRLGAAEIAAAAGSLVDLARRERAGPDGGPPGVLLVAPPRLGAPTISSELWGFGTARETSATAGARSTGRPPRSPARPSSTPAPLVAADPADGVHLDPAAHAVLGRAVAVAVEDLLRGAAAARP